MAGKPKPRKAGGADAPKKKAKAKAEKPPKKTVEQLTDMELQKLTLSYKNKAIPLLEREKEAKAAVKALFEQAKNEGVSKKDIDLALKLDIKLHDPEKHDANVDKAEREIERILRVARWMRVEVGTQFELFGATKETKQERLFEDGRVAALNDQPAKPPAHLAQKDAQVWLDGHAAGRTALNTERAGGFKTLGDSLFGNVAELARKAGVENTTIGTEQPTHAEAA